MMKARRGVAAYESALKTEPPLAIVVRLFDGILAAIANARDAVENKDSMAHFVAAQKAARILDGLDRCLTPPNGASDVASRLSTAYRANIFALYRTVGQPDADEALERIGQGLRNIRNAWAEIGNLPSSKETTLHPVSTEPVEKNEPSGEQTTADL